MYRLDKVKLEVREASEKLGHTLEPFETLRLIHILDVYSGATYKSRCSVCLAPIRINIDVYDAREYVDVEGDEFSFGDRTGHKCTSFQDVAARRREVRITAKKKNLICQPIREFNKL